MKPITIRPCAKIRGKVLLPADKSISHRAAILAALSPGRTLIRNFLFSDDCLATISALKAMGVSITPDLKKNEVLVFSRGLLRASQRPLDMKESGTSARVLAGLLAGQSFQSVLTASPSLLKRPMKRIIAPLSMMGADIRARRKQGEYYLPLEIFPSLLTGIEWKQEVASAQVKSAILLAGLSAHGETVVIEPVPTRDHTERMLKLFGAEIRFKKGWSAVRRSELSSPGSLEVPGDISSAAFFAVAALIIKGSRVLIKNCGINPTRTGAIDVLKRMGGFIRLIGRKAGYEPYSDMEVASSGLKGCRISSSEIPSLIDELPVLMVAAAMAEGRTVIEGAQELRVKETDRVYSMVFNLKKAGVRIETAVNNGREDIVIYGQGAIKAGNFRSFGDHRTAMSMFVASLAAEGGTSKLDDISCANKSFPGFIDIFRHLLVR